MRQLRLQLAQPLMLLLGAHECCHVGAGARRSQFVACARATGATRMAVSGAIGCRARAAIWLGSGQRHA
jgi:hypothetical protein